MKFRAIFFFKNQAENEAGRLVPDHFFIFKTDLYEVKAGGVHLSFNIFLQPSTWTYNKYKSCKTLKS